MPEAARVVTTDIDMDAAIRRARVFSKYDQRVRRATYSARKGSLSLRLENGTSLAIPVKLLQGLSQASADELGRIEILGHGTGLYWPELDVAHSVSGLLGGVFGSAKWMEQLQGSAEPKRIPA